jgi:hypothetical protein
MYAQMNWLFRHAQSAGQIDLGVARRYTWDLGARGMPETESTGDVRQATDLTEKLSVMGYRKPRV